MHGDLIDAVLAAMGAAHAAERTAIRTTNPIRRHFTRARAARMHRRLDTAHQRLNAARLHDCQIAEIATAMNL